MPDYENSTSHMSSGNHIIYPCTGSFCLNWCVYVHVVYHVFLINLQTVDFQGFLMYPQLSLPSPPTPPHSLLSNIPLSV